MVRNTNQSSIHKKTKRGKEKVMKRCILIIILCISLSLSLRSIGLTEQQAPGGQRHIGTVMEILYAGKYIYLKIKEGSSERWITTYKRAIGTVSKGDRIQYFGGFEMTNFESNILGRKFKKILFVSRASRFGGKIKDFKNVPADEYHRKVMKTVEASKPPEKGEIKPPEGGITVEEVYSKLDELNGKEILLRGKVMKVNRNILGKNWITLSDGTGKAPDNVLTVVTKEDTEAGKIVTVKGKIRKDVDLGAGYKYKVLLEDAEIEK